VNLEARLAEMRARIELSQGHASLLLAVVPHEAELDDVRSMLTTLLGVGLGVDVDQEWVCDLGTCSSQRGPARWVEATQQQPAAAHVLAFASSSPLETRAFAQLLNTERGLLGQLRGPVVLLVSQPAEQGLRRHAHDFFTWVAQAYMLPDAQAFREQLGRAGIGGPMGDSAKASTPESPLRFLHVSDLHLRPQRVARYDQDKVLRGLVQHLERDREAAPLDLVFVTGDLGHGGRPEEYALVIDLLERLLQVTGVPKERLFVVPGNHDVDRGVGRWLRRTLDEDMAAAFFEQPEDRRFHRQKFEAYEQSMRGWLGPHRSLGLGVGAEAVEVVEVRGTRLAVASFNSAWMSQDDADDGKLWIGEPSVMRAIDRIADEGVAFAVALLHHPLHALHEGERGVVERWFERGIDMVLRGHLHAERTRVITSARGGYLEVAAPATYQGSSWGNGCFVGEIRARARSVRLRPLGYVAGPDPWVLDTTVFPDDGEEGYRATFVVPPKRRVRSGVAAPLRAAVEQAYRQISSRQQQVAREIVRGEAVAPGGAPAPAKPTRSMTRGPVAKSAPSPSPSPSPSRARSIETARGDERDYDPQTLLALEDSPSLRREILGQDEGVRLVSALEQVERERVTIEDFEGFEAVLRQAAALLRQQAERLGLELSKVHVRTVGLGLAAALGAVAEQTIAVLEPDILMGEGRERCVIEVARLLPHRVNVDAALARLGRFMRETTARFGALVFVGSSPSEAPTTSDAPVAERITTDSGEPVVILVL